jgi:hypothetical protein
MHINYSDDGTIASIDVEPTGDRRKTLEKALQRYFHHKSDSVKWYRAGLMAAGVADASRSHPNYADYKRLADRMTVETLTVDHWNGRYSDDMTATRVEVTVE